jgi:hypothetical protein
MEVAREGGVEEWAKDVGREEGGLSSRCVRSAEASRRRRVADERKGVLEPKMGFDTDRERSTRHARGPESEEDEKGRREVAGAMEGAGEGEDRRRWEKTRHESKARQGD